MPVHIQCIENQQFPLKGLPDSCDHFDGFGSLHTSYDPDQRRKHACGSAIQGLNVLRFWEKTVITRCRWVADIKDTDLPVKPDRGT